MKSSSSRGSRITHKSAKFDSLGAGGVSQRDRSGSNASAVRTKSHGVEATRSRAVFVTERRASRRHAGGTDDQRRVGTACSRIALRLARRDLEPPSSSTSPSSARAPRKLSTSSGSRRRRRRGSGRADRRRIHPRSARRSSDAAAIDRPCCDEARRREIGVAGWRTTGDPPTIPTAVRETVAETQRSPGDRRRATAMASARLATYATPTILAVQAAPIFAPFVPTGLPLRTKWRPS